MVVQIQLADLPDNPGTELKLILETLDITERPGCDCTAKMHQMSLWGVAGCRERFDEIVGWMRDGAPRWGWTDKLSVSSVFKAVASGLAGTAAKAVASGLAKELKDTGLWKDWLDPFPALVEVAIRRAEAKLNAEAANTL